VVRWGVRSGEGGGGRTFGRGEVKVKTWTDEGVRPHTSISHTSIVEGRDPFGFAQDDKSGGRIRPQVRGLPAFRGDNLRTPVCPSLSPDGTIHLYAKTAYHCVPTIGRRDDAAG
jgi:hypothetical protein